MKKIQILLTLLLLSLVSVQAQTVAGYLGRRLTVFGDVKSFLRISNPSAKEGGLPLNMKIGGGIDYICYKRFSISLSYETFKTGFETDIPYFEEASYSSGAHYSYTSKILGASVSTYGLNFNFFSKNKGTLAPYGSYSTLGLKFITMTEQDYRDVFGDSYASSSGFSLTDPQYSTYGYGLTYGLGKKWIYFDRLILDIGFQATLTMNKSFKPSFFIKTKERPYTNYYNSGYGDEDEIADPELNIENDMVKRVGAHYGLDFHIGLGFLIF